MIFRRSNPPAPAKNSSAPTQRASQPQPQRREPELSAPRPTPSYQPGGAPLAMTPTQPVSPLAVAQARRTTTGNPMSSFARQEQVRKLTVGRDISLNGEITTCDHLIVEGSVKATIKGGQVLEIAECGTFEGVVDIDSAEIAGTFAGDLIVRSKLVLRSTANVTGTIRYGSLQVDTGARLMGEIAVLQTVMQQPSTPQQSQYAATENTSNGGYDLSSALHQPGFLKASA